MSNETAEQQVLTTETVEAGMRLEVWAHPNTQAVAYQGERGTVSVAPAPDSQYAGVVLDGYGSEPLWIPVYDLRAL